jgi:NADH pyrophosphatase NudC (nudix superfamily)
VLVSRGDEVLLARSPGFPPGMYSVLAGFVEPGESIEETIGREIREEVGVEVEYLRYFGSQPWPFPNSLMIGFTADYAGRATYRTRGDRGRRLVHGGRLTAATAEGQHRAGHDR